ncbi:trehalase family glycosidase [Aquimarina gracilis]|uniref:Trehalase family glycosidase n=1 Tax=Aquimarina gracilis TaxID=874422 RepID=A0ABU5ZZ67_9FLAO|nr:trehalase family glycosidase [Aquimarina gracilis]MEB3347115.1 trehalase family glycosidase [Aquimarina gracilis]
MQRREFTKKLGLTVSVMGISGMYACKDETTVSETKPKPDCPSDFKVTPELSERMYNRALEITKSKVRGGDTELFFKKPFIDAAFSQNIFLWDTCFMVCFAKYHLDELPVYQALDNFYDRIDNDGYICREYRQDGSPLWSKEHPVSINPPLLAFAELEIYSISQDKERLKKVYPILKKNFEFLVRTYQMEDDLFYADTLGMGMDNIQRYPKGWNNDGNGMTHHELGEKLGKMDATGEERLNTFIAEYPKTLQGVWNKQGRLVDFSSQMAMLADQLKTIAEVIGVSEDIASYTEIHDKISRAINKFCWNEEDSIYYDLGFGKQIKRKHIGMYWALLGKVVPEDRMERFLSHLENPEEFGRRTPLPALSADDPDYRGWGDYWRGGVWAPTSYMVLKGLKVCGQDTLAKRLAQKTYQSVAEVFAMTHTFWENYSPDLISYGMPAKKDFCGWTALIPIAVYKEFVS